MTNEPNELLDTAVDAIMIAIGGAFEEMWSAPDAPETVEAFLSGRVSFHLHRDGLQVLVATEDDAA